MALVDRLAPGVAPGHELGALLPEEDNSLFSHGFEAAIIPFMFDVPDYARWLNERDRAMHPLGWFFYRDAPWGLPPGDSPHLGIELASSIGLVDGLPLFALPAKLLSPWLPHPFQYWGDWLLISIVLQAVFAYAVAREMRPDLPFERFDVARFSALRPGMPATAVVAALGAPTYRSDRWFLYRLGADKGAGWLARVDFATDGTVAGRRLEAFD